MKAWCPLLLVLLCAADAGASECIGLWTRNLLGNQAVFVGEVISITTVGSQDEIRFRVDEALKFDIPHRNPFTLTQWTHGGTTDYDHHFQVGNRYLVSASNSKGHSTPGGVTSRMCDAWEIHTAEGARRRSEVRVLLRNRQFLPLRH